MTAEHDNTKPTSICLNCQSVRQLNSPVDDMITCHNEKSDHFEHIFMADHPACPLFTEKA